MSPRSSPHAGTVEIAPDIRWVHECFALPGGHHVHVSVYLVRGPEGNLVIDSGSFVHREGIRSRIEAELGGAPLHSIVLSHTDYPHSGNVPAFLHRWGEVEIVASCSDAEVQGLPYARRSRIGEQLDVCGRSLLFLDPPLADRSHTTWIYDEAEEVVFAADGFGSYHEDGECDLPSDRLAGGVRARDIYAFHDDSLPWLRWVDPPRLEAALQALVTERPVRWICPIHGHPIHRDQLASYMSHLVDAVRAIALEG